MQGASRKYAPYRFSYFATSLLYCWLVASFTPLAAQPLNLRSEHIIIEDGISGIRVSAILQDRQGFLWFGMHIGLNRFDGYAFKTYWHRPDDTTSISGNSIEELYEDNQGHLWIGGGGLVIYDPKTEQLARFRAESGNQIFMHQVIFANFQSISTWRLETFKLEISYL